MCWLNYPFPELAYKKAVSQFSVLILLTVTDNSFLLFLNQHYGHNKVYEIMLPHCRF